MSDKKKGAEGEGKKKSKKKLLVPILVLVVAGVGYKMKFAPKPPPPPKPKIEGTVMALEKEFVVNLADGHYGKISVALVVEEAAGGGGHAAGEAGLAQEGVVRAIITDTLTGMAADDLVSKTGREKALEEILTAVKKQTDEHVKEVYFTDVAVQ